MDNRKSVPEMLGECLREAAVLTAVFIPLDKVMIGEALTPAWYLVILAISGTLVVVGMAVERMGKE
jgi:hypothetical protein